jgi:hypothetical protein
MSRAHIPDGSSSFRTPLPIRCSMFGRQALLPDSLKRGHETLHKENAST